MGSCSLKNFHNRPYDINERNFDYMSWKSEQNSSNIIIAVHGYNDYSNAFKLPAEYLIKHSIELISFDLRGFGKRSDRGEWFDLEIHLDDLKIFINKIKHDNPNKNIFLLGESMGGAIALSLANRNKDIPINGVILVSPAIWNFSKTNFFKSIALRSLSLIFPNLKVSGKGIIKVQASNNIEMLKELSQDEYFIQKPTFKSLDGIVNLMDRSYIDSIEFLKNPNYDTIMLIPIIDEIVPRKPLIKILENQKKNTTEISKLKIYVYDKNFHMILRDINGVIALDEIKDWVLEKKENLNSQNLSQILKK